ncbi:maltase A1 [Anabrus simplex]|uniref:maltase A1 n=1 Tax=Anabrus simplex TaxID=316456 RepID=UPI0035A3D19C
MLLEYHHFIMIATPYLVAILAVAAFTTAAEDTLDWWQTTVFYQIYPRSFKDSDGDGVGDLKGITSKMEHLKDAGIGAAWLSPIFKSPMVDFGYDIADFKAIEPLFGTIDDFKELKEKMTNLGIKLILDFVPNHSSNLSEWFQNSVKKIDPYTDYYVWVDGKPNADDPSKMDPPNNWLSNFGGSAWEWNEERGQFYLHQFAAGQPDLNYRNPVLVEEMKNVLRYWLDIGVDGFRVDAVPYLFEREDLPDEPKSGDPNAKPNEEKYLLHIYTQNQPETFDMISQFRAVVDEYKARDGHTRVMMVEAYANLTETMKYYGTPEKPGAHFPFNFQFISYLNNASTGQDVRDYVLQWEQNKPSWAWSNWVVGNHDNHRVASRFGPQLTDGINMLIQLLPGSAVTYNGEEIGMEDTFISWEQSKDPIALNAGPDRYTLFTRDPERTPFQWDDSTSAGFSQSETTWLPVNSNYKTLNLENEREATESHYKVYQKLVKLRNLNAIQTGALDIQAAGSNVVILSRYLSSEPSVIVAVNMGSDSETVDVTSLKGVSETLEVYTVSIESDLNEGDKVDPKAVRLGPKDGVVLLTA